MNQEMRSFMKVFHFKNNNNFASEYNNFKHILEITNTRIFLFEAFSSWLSLQWALSLLVLHHQQRCAPQCLSNQQQQKNLTHHLNSRWSDWSENWKIYFSWRMLSSITSSDKSLNWRCQSLWRWHVSLQTMLTLLSSSTQSRQWSASKSSKWQPPWEWTCMWQLYNSELLQQWQNHSQFMKSQRILWER